VNQNDLATFLRSIGWQVALPQPASPANAGAQ